MKLNLITALTVFLGNCTIVLLLITMLVLPVAAQPQPLTSSEIDALKAKLVEAQNINTAFSVRVQCYVDKDASFEARSSQLQQTAGGLHRKKKELSSKLVQTKSTTEGFRSNLKKAQQEMDKLTEDMSNIEAEIQAGQTTLDDCKSQLWILGFVCEPVGELGVLFGLNSSLSKLSADREEIRIKMNGAQGHLNTAESNHNQAAERFRETQSTLAKTKQDIKVTEAEIKVIKASLSEIRTITQDYSTELVNFQDTFTEFENLDSSSDRRFIVYRLRNESASLNDLLVKARGLLHEDGLQLPSGKRICAN